MSKFGRPNAYEKASTLAIQINQRIAAALGDPLFALVQVNVHALNEQCPRVRLDVDRHALTSDNAPEIEAFLKRTQAELVKLFGAKAP